MNPIYTLFSRMSSDKLSFVTCMGLVGAGLVGQSTQALADTMYVYRDDSGQSLLTNLDQPDGSLSKYKKRVSKKTYASTNNPANRSSAQTYNSYNPQAYQQRSQSYYTNGYNNYSNYASTSNYNYQYSQPVSYSSRSNSRHRNAYDKMIVTSARRHGVDPALVKAIIHTESAFNARARSPVGAQGLMQLMPGTARDLNVYNVWNPAENIDGGTKYIAQLLRRFNNNVELALAGYNAGPNRESLRNGRIPNISETKNYVKKVLSRYHRLYKNDPNLRGAGAYNASYSYTNGANGYIRGASMASSGGNTLGMYEVTSPPPSFKMSTTRVGYQNANSSSSSGFQRVGYGSISNGSRSVYTNSY